MDKIITALDYAKRNNCSTVRAHIEMICADKIKRGLMDRKIDLGHVSGKKAYAELNYGQWIARCECGGAEAVDPGEPIFFCHSCGNYANKGKLRPVVFPDDRKEIEKEVMRRPVEIGAGTHEIERLTLARPTKRIPGRGELSRSWVPGETIGDIKAQNKMGGI